MYAYKVRLNGKEIDKVFYNTKQDRADVKRSLVEHDGYDPNITIAQERNKLDTMTTQQRRNSD